MNSAAANVRAPAVRPPGRRSAEFPTAPRSAEDSAWPFLETVQSVLLAGTIAILGIAPRAGAIVLCALALVTLVYALRARQKGASTPATPNAKRGIPAIEAISPHRRVATLMMSPLVAVAALVAWAGASSAWAKDPGLALSSVAQVALILAATFATIQLLPAQIAALPSVRQRRFRRAVPIGFAIGLGFVAVEFATGNTLTLAAVGRWPALMGDNAKDFVRDGDRLVALMPFHLDRNVAALTLLLPAVVVALRAWLPPRSRGLATAIALAAAAIVIVLSWSGAAKLAAAIGLITALIWREAPRATSIVLAAVLTAGVTLAIPIALLLATMGLDRNASLPASARERIAIWSATAVAVRATPIVGIGVQSTRFIAPGDLVHVDGINGARRPLGWHAHNAILQTWLEMGAIGAALLAWALLTVVQTIRRRVIHSQSASAALFVMTNCIAVTGWGMWQPWLAATIGIAALSLSAVSQRQQDFERSLLAKTS